MNAPVRIGLAGCGRLAEVGYLPALARAETVRLAAVADPDPRRRRLAGEGVPGFPGIEPLLASGTVDAVIVATPSGAHLAQATRVAAAGLPVLVEKPPAADAREARRLAALTPAPWIAFNRRFVPGIARLHRVAAGDTERCALDLRMSYRRRTWRPLCADDDALLDLGPHLIDLARWLSGQEVTAVAARRVEPGAAAFELALERGRARVRCAVGRPYRERVEIAGPRRRSQRFDSGGVRALAHHRVAGRGRESPLVASLTAQVQAFARAVRGGDPGALAGAADGVAAMAILDGVRRSAAEGRTVALAELAA